MTLPDPFVYPKAPQLAFGTDLTPAQEFWTIKHGIKLTAMPAWGRTHSDAARPDTRRSSAAPKSPGRE